MADLVRLDVGHTHPRSLITMTAEAALTEVTAAKVVHRTATVTEALAVTTMMTGHRAIVRPLAGQWKITRPLEAAMMSLTAAIIHLLLPTLMSTAVDLPMTGHLETFLLGSQHTLEKDMRETTIVVDVTDDLPQTDLSIRKVGAYGLQKLVITGFVSSVEGRGVWT